MDKAEKTTQSKSTVKKLETLKNGQPQNEGPPDISQAREMLKKGNEKKAREIATVEFNSLINMNKLTESVELCKEFSLPANLVQKVYDKYIGKELFLEAADLAIQFKLSKEKITEAALKLFAFKMQSRDYDLVPAIIKKYKLSDDTTKKSIKSAFEYDVTHDKIEKAAYAVEVFKLEYDIVGPIVLPIIREKIQSKNFDIAKNLFDKLSIPVEDFLPELLEVFSLFMQRGSFKQAKRLKDDFALLPEHYIESAKEAFRSQVQNDNLDVAKNIMKVYNLDPSFTKPIIKEAYDEYIRNNQLVRALAFGKDFSVKPSILRDDAWDLFLSKLSAGDFAVAANIAETYGISQQKVNKKVKSLYEELKKKGKNDIALRLDEQFVIKGKFLSIFFK